MSYTVNHTTCLWALPRLLLGPWGERLGTGGAWGDSVLCLDFRSCTHSAQALPLALPQNSTHHHIPSPSSTHSRQNQLLLPKSPSPHPLNSQHRHPSYSKGFIEASFTYKSRTEGQVYKQESGRDPEGSGWNPKKE